MYVCQSCTNSNSSNTVVYIQCIFSVYSVYIQCIFSVYSVYIQCIFSVYSVYILYCVMCMMGSVHTPVTGQLMRSAIEQNIIHRLSIYIYTH